MGALSPVLRNVEGGGLTFWCPGCQCGHTVHVGDGPGPRWGWNGDVAKPTFTPSVFVKTVRLTDENRDAYDALCSPDAIRATVDDPRFRWWCHSFVANGRIQFLTDSSHALAGQTVDLPEKWTC